MGGRYADIYLSIALRTREEVYHWTSKEHSNFNIAHEFILCPMVLCSMEEEHLLVLCETCVIFAAIPHITCISVTS